MPICRIKLKAQFNTVVLVIVYLIYSHLLSNVLTDIKDETITQLTQANSLLVDAMHNLQLAYSNSRFSLSNTTTCYDTATCSALQSAGVSNLITASSLQQASTKIAYITSGFIPTLAQSASNCTYNSSTQKAPVDAYGFSSCLSSSYAGYLAIEVRFKSAIVSSTISGALDNKIVLFLAKGPGTNSSFIIKSASSLPTIDNVAFFSCINNNGSVGDGLNNAGKLGSITMQSSSSMLITYLPNGGAIGGFGTCLR